MNRTVKKNSVAGVRRGRPRSGASEQAILSATLELLAELGFRAVTVDAIAARAGASKSTIYRRWPTKEYLVIAAFAQTPNL
ncbi:MAG: helix-turn-helix domain-containing protein, partial [Pseudomonadales bacterium]